MSRGYELPKPFDTLDIRQVLPAAYTTTDPELQRQWYDVTGYIASIALNRYGWHGANNACVERTDVVQEVASRLLRYGFDPSIDLDDREISEDEKRSCATARLTLYINRVVESIVVDTLTIANRETSGYIDDDTGQPLALNQLPTGIYDNSDVTETFLENPQAARLLTVAQQRMIKLWLVHRNHKAMALEEGVAVEALKVRMSRIRSKLERHILEPSGLFRLSAFATDERPLITIREYVREGVIPAIHIMKLYYIKADWIDAHRLPDTAGLIRLSTIASGPDAESFVRQHENRLVRSGVGVYIHETDMPLLESFIEQRSHSRRPDPLPPAPGYTPLTGRAATQQESNYLRNVYKSGRFSSPILQGKYKHVFILTEEADEVLSMYRTNRLK